MFTVVALGPVTCKTNGTGSQLTTVNKKRIIIEVKYVLYCNFVIWRLLLAEYSFFILTPDRWHSETFIRSANIDQSR